MDQHCMLFMEVSSYNDEISFFCLQKLETRIPLNFSQIHIFMINLFLVYNLTNETCICVIVIRVNHLKCVGFESKISRV